MRTRMKERFGSWSFYKEALAIGIPVMLQALIQSLVSLIDSFMVAGLGDVKIKKFLNNIMQEELSPIRARRAEYEKDIPAVYEILKNGSETAREAAAQTMAEVKRAMRINYFEDAELIKSQSQKYAEK